MFNGLSKMAIVIRMGVGAYLLYLVYSLFPDVMAREGTSRIVMLAIMAVFGVAGLSLLILGVKALLEKEEVVYEAGDEETPRDTQADTVDDSTVGSETADDAVIEAVEDKSDPDEDGGV